ncbi:MAG: YfcC family protein, partial [Halanaerobiales bacterium]
MKIRVPHSYVLIFIILIVVAFLTYIIPAGSYERMINNQGIVRVEPDSFQLLDSSPVSIFGLFQGIYEGMLDSADIIFFVFIIGGVFNIIKSTGIIKQGIKSLLKYFENREKLIIPILVFAFSLAGAILGISEEILPFYPILVSLAVLLGFDNVTGTAIGLLGVTSGFVAGFLNPFTVAIAQGIAGLPLFSGLTFRVVVYLIFVSTTIIYIMRYARKISKNPELSVTYDKNNKVKYNLDEIPSFKNKHLRVIIILIVGYSYLLYGIIEKDFYISEITAVFLMMGIVIGFVTKMEVNSIATKFINGAGNLVNGALIIGFARAITIIMEKGNILDTIIFALVSLIKGMSPVLNAISMFVVQLFLGIFIPSGSGQAAATMPIMVPHSDLVGITRQTAVLAYQLGDGFVNAISPTSGFFMAAIALSDIPWNK